MNAAEADPRLAFFEPEEQPQGPRDPGPSVDHRLHVAFPRGPNQELRLTSQAGRVEKGKTFQARLVLRRWWRRPDGTWWPVAAERGLVVLADEAADFGRAVAEAVEALANDGGKP